MNKIKVAILGTGKIGTDLLVKVNKSDKLECTLFVGRNLNSAGLKFASKFPTTVISDKSIQCLIDNLDKFDVVVDCTSAQAHLEHWKVLENTGKIVIDLTPAKLGEMCVPVLNSEELIDREVQNYNMVTCGGQTALPIACAISSIHKNIDYIEVASNIASKSAGPATRYNLDEYVETTENALSIVTGVSKTKAILILNPAEPCIDMQTTVYAKIKNPDIEALTSSVQNMVEKLKQYVPGYQVVVPPTIIGNNVVTTIKVVGAGDYLPPYAGNLDIINCAATAVLELLWKKKYG